MEQVGMLFPVSGGDSQYVSHFSGNLAAIVNCFPIAGESTAWGVAGEHYHHFIGNAGK